MRYFFKITRCRMSFRKETCGIFSESCGKCAVIFNNNPGKYDNLFEIMLNICGNYFLNGT